MARYSLIDSPYWGVPGRLNYNPSAPVGSQMLIGNPNLRKKKRKKKKLEPANILPSSRHVHEALTSQFMGGLLPKAIFTPEQQQNIMRRRTFPDNLPVGGPVSSRPVVGASGLEPAGVEPGKGRINYSADPSTGRAVYGVTQGQPVVAGQHYPRTGDEAIGYSPSGRKRYHGGAPVKGKAVYGVSPPPAGSGAVDIPAPYPDAGGMDYQKRSIKNIRGDIQAAQLNQARIEREEEARQRKASIAHAGEFEGLPPVLPEEDPLVFGGPGDPKYSGVQEFLSPLGERIEAARYKTAEEQIDSEVANATQNAKAREDALRAAGAPEAHIKRVMGPEYSGLTERTGVQSVNMDETASIPTHITDLAYLTTGEELPPERRGNVDEFWGGFFQDAGRVANDTKEFVSGLVSGEAKGEVDSIAKKSNMSSSDVDTLAENLEKKAVESGSPAAPDKKTVKEVLTATDPNRIWGDFRVSGATRKQKYINALNDMYKKAMILNVIAALTGTESQAGLFLEMAGQKFEALQKFDGMDRLENIRRGVFYTRDGRFDAPQTREEAFKRAIKFGASPEEAKKLSGWAAAKEDTPGGVTTEQFKIYQKMLKNKHPMARQYGMMIGAVRTRDKELSPSNIVKLLDMAEMETLGLNEEETIALKAELRAKLAEKGLSSLRRKSPVTGDEVEEEAASESIVRISAGPNSSAEYDALPSGTVFIGPDGKRRKKP